jgi:hypothetical protein
VACPVLLEPFKSRSIPLVSRFPMKTTDSRN